MSRLTTTVVNASGTFTVPAGVSTVIVTPVDNTGSPVGQSTSLTTSDPSYTVTISGNGALGSPNTFGSIYRWVGSSALRIGWVE